MRASTLFTLRRAQDYACIARRLYRQTRRQHGGHSASGLQTFPVCWVIVFFPSLLGDFKVFWGRCHLHRLPKPPEVQVAQPVLLRPRLPKKEQGVKVPASSPVLEQFSVDKHKAVSHARNHFCRCKHPAEQI